MCIQVNVRQLLLRKTVTLQIGLGSVNSVVQGISLYNTPVVASEIPVHKELLSPYAKFVKVNLGYPDTNGVYWIPDVDDAVEKIMSIGETRHKYGRKVHSTYNVNRAIGDFKQLFNLA